MNIATNGSDIFRHYRADKSYRRFLGEANRMFLGRPDYVALAPCGSRFKGYAVEDSDFDIILIAGDATYVTEGSFSAQLKGLAEGYGKSGACLPFCFNIGYFEANLAVPTPSANYAYDHAVWPLLYPLTGKHAAIERLRRLAKAKHAEYRSRWPAAAIQNLRESVRATLYHEWGVHVHVTQNGICTLDKQIGYAPFSSSTTVEKCLTRGLSKKDVQGIIESRGRFWWRRAVQVLEHEK